VCLSISNMVCSEELKKLELSPQISSDSQDEKAGDINKAAKNEKDVEDARERSSVPDSEVKMGKPPTIVRKKEDINDIHERSTAVNSEVKIEHSTLIKKENVESGSEQIVKPEPSPSRQKLSTTPSRRLSLDSDSPLSDPPSDLESPTASPCKGKAPVSMKKEKEDYDVAFVSTRPVGNRRT
jgi:hypothetical protein